MYDCREPQLSIALRFDEEVPEVGQDHDPVSSLTNFVLCGFDLRSTNHVAVVEVRGRFLFGRRGDEKLERSAPYSGGRPMSEELRPFWPTLRRGANCSEG